jgi:hypothetical protein
MVQSSNMDFWRTQKIYIGLGFFVRQKSISDSKPSIICIMSNPLFYESTKSQPHALGHPTEIVVYYKTLETSPTGSCEHSEPHTIQKGSEDISGTLWRNAFRLFSLRSALQIWDFIIIIIMESVDTICKPLLGSANYKTSTQSTALRWKLFKARND